MTKINIREAFRGDDASKHIRRMAKSMMDIGLEHAEEKRIAALTHQYTSAPYLEVIVQQIRIDPPVWRMETVTPIIAEFGKLAVEEQDRRHLEPELRLAAARILLRYGYVQTWDDARERVKEMKIHQQGRIVVPKDSERHLFERRR